MLPSDPLIGIKLTKVKSKPHRRWAPADIEQYKMRHPLGTKPRLAFDLLRFTTGRREDAPRLGPRNVQGDRIRFIQAKNEHRKPIQIDIPLHPDLKASIVKAFMEAPTKNKVAFDRLSDGKDREFVAVTHKDYENTVDMIQFVNDMRKKHS